MKTTSTPTKSREKAAPRRKSAAVHSDPAEHIAVAAYFKAQARGFAPGGELDDWLQAESEFSPRAGSA